MAAILHLINTGDKRRMRYLPQAIGVIIWGVLVLLTISRPPQSPKPFPEPRGALLPVRSIYNPELAAKLDQNLRDYWQKPDRVLDALGDLDGLTVADVGCGEGYFTLRLLERVGPAGKVLATDIQDNLLRQLEQRVPEVFKSRIELILSEPDRVGIEEPVDVILLIQVLGEIEGQVAFLDQLQNIMHEGSRLILIDSKHITNPETGYTRPLDYDKLRAGLQKSGFRVSEDVQEGGADFLPKQFFFILEKDSSSVAR